MLQARLDNTLSSYIMMALNNFLLQKPCEIGIKIIMSGSFGMNLRLWKILINDSNNSLDFGMITSMIEVFDIVNYQYQSFKLKNDNKINQNSIKNQGRTKDYVEPYNTTEILQDLLKFFLCD